MKGLILGLLISLSASAQKDTTIQVSMSLNEFKMILSAIDQNIDSKRVTKDLIDFLKSRAQIVADKPKEIKPKN